MTGATFQALDQAKVAAWLGDATLSTTLKVTYDWKGFFASLAAADGALTTPNAPGAKPVAGAYFQLGYLDAPGTINQTMRVRRGLLTIWFRVQPSVTDFDAFLDAAGATKARIDALSTTEAWVDVKPPLAETTPRNGWPEAALRLPCWLGDHS